MAISALFPLIIGMIWYNPKVFGTAWLRVNNFDADKMKEGFNMPLVFGLTFVFGLFVSMMLAGIVIHQMGFFSMLQKNFKDAGVQADFMSMMGKYGNDFRTFKHGMLHGTIMGIGMALPIIAINAMFERRGFKYVMIHTGFWILCFILMGGFICQFANLNSLG
jgi:hypothetical protein